MAGHCLWRDRWVDACGSGDHAFGSGAEHGRDFFVIYMFGVLYVCMCVCVCVCVCGGGEIICMVWLMIHKYSMAWR